MYNVRRTGEWLKVSHIQTSYALDGTSLFYTSTRHQLFFPAYGKNKMTKFGKRWTIIATASAMFNHVGHDIMSHHSEHTLRIGLSIIDTTRKSSRSPGCVAVTP
ncbi:hypothetical protein OG21DRAFT_913845 [Imleria badia]|nr:hypothetical protein OG21DRAFT_913845 [Imleria badia]